MPGQPRFLLLLHRELDPVPPGRLGPVEGGVGGGDQGQGIGSHGVARRRSQAHGQERDPNGGDDSQRRTSRNGVSTESCQTVLAGS